MAVSIIILISLFCVVLIPSVMIELLVSGTKTEHEEMGVIIDRTSH